MPDLFESALVITYSTPYTQSYLLNRQSNRNISNREPAIDVGKLDVIEGHQALSWGVRWALYSLYILRIFGTWSMLTQRIILHFIQPLVVNSWQCISLIFFDFIKLVFL